MEDISSMRVGDRVIVVAVLLCTVLSFLFGYIARGCVERGQQASSDTVVVIKDSIVHDTISIKYPVYHKEVVVDSIRVPVNLHDTVMLPRVQREYQDSTYHAWVSGCDPVLDSIFVFKTNLYRTIEKKITNTIRPKFSIGLQTGYGITPKGLLPYIGAGIQYNF